MDGFQNILSFLRGLFSGNHDITHLFDFIPEDLEVCNPRIVTRSRGPVLDKLLGPEMWKVHLLDENGEMDIEEIISKWTYVWAAAICLIVLVASIYFVI